MVNKETIHFVSMKVPMNVIEVSWISRDKILSKLKMGDKYTVD